MTTTATTTTAQHDKENAFSSSNKRKADIPRSNGRRAVVFAPKEEPFQSPSSSVRTWMEAIQQRHKNVLATTDHTVLHLLQVAATASDSKMSHKMIQDAVQEETGNAASLLQELDETANRVERQIDQDNQTLRQLQESLNDLMEQKQKLNEKIADLDQEVVCLRMENMSLGDQVKATAGQLTTMEKLEAKRHRRILHQLTFFKRLSGIIWDYATIEKDSNRLVGQVVRDDLFLCFAMLSRVWLSHALTHVVHAIICYVEHPFEANLSRVRV